MSLTACSTSQVIVVLTLVCSSFVMPAALPDTESLATAESLQMESTQNKVMADSVPEDDRMDVLVEVLRLPHGSPSVRIFRAVEATPQETKTFSPERTDAEVSALADDVVSGKKVVVMIEFFNTPDYGKVTVRKQRSEEEEEETTTASGVSTATETSDKVAEKTEDPSHKPQTQKQLSDVKREIRSFEFDRNVHDDGNDDDMSVAETIIFRPLFSYRQDTAARRRSFRDVSRIEPTYDYY
jgi:hypothetical protein